MTSFVWSASPILQTMKSKLTVPIPSTSTSPRASAGLQHGLRLPDASEIGRMLSKSVDQLSEALVSGRAGKVGAQPGP